MKAVLRTHVMILCALLLSFGLHQAVLGAGESSSSSSERQSLLPKVKDDSPADSTWARSFHHMKECFWAWISPASRSVHNESGIPSGASYQKDQKCEGSQEERERLYQERLYNEAVNQSKRVLELIGLIKEKEGSFVIHHDIRSLEADIERIQFLRGDAVGVINRGEELTDRQKDRHLQDMKDKMDRMEQQLGNDFDGIEDEFNQLRTEIENFMKCQVPMVVLW